MSVIVEARNVSLRYRSDASAAVENIAFVLPAGAAVGVVGESGSGKSTLAKLIAGQLAPTVGDVLISGRSWTTVSARDPLRRRVQMIFQDPYGALNPWMAAQDAVAEVFQHWEGDPKKQALERARQLLAETGLSRDAMTRRPRELSGGQCQRVGIARALACGPDLLIADEPTSALDVSVQAQILNTLVQLRESRGLTLLIVSHDLAVIRYVTDTGLVMYGGRVVERGPTADLLSTPSHPYTQILVDSIPGRDGTMRATLNPVSDTHPCRFANRCPRLAPECAELRQLGDASLMPRYAECVRPLVQVPADQMDR